MNNFKSIGIRMNPWKIPITKKIKLLIGITLYYPKLFLLFLVIEGNLYAISYLFFLKIKRKA